MKMIITEECEKCMYGTVNDDDPRRVTVYCKAKDKTYYYGQCVPCEDYKKKR